MLRGQANGSVFATIWVELKPKSIELTPSQAEEYLEEIDAPTTVREQWAGRQSGAQWREVYVKHAKTFVRQAEDGDRSLALPVGTSLEIVPETDPTRLHAGDEIAVRLLKDCKPISGG